MLKATKYEIQRMLCSTTVRQTNAVGINPFYCLYVHSLRQHLQGGMIKKQAAEGTPIGGARRAF